jgi:hypothetical protein
MTPSQILTQLVKTAAARRKRALIASDAVLDKLAKQHQAKPR